MRTFRFYKDEVGWFIDLKWWKFGKHHLTMVCGADLFLDKLSKGKDEVSLQVSSKHFQRAENSIVKVDYKELGFFQGRVYTGDTSNLIPHTLFEHNQLIIGFGALFVFGHYPKRIFYKTLKN